MNIQEKKVISDQLKSMCVSCKNFYGNAAFNNMCSQCYKKNQKTTPIEPQLTKVQPLVQAQQQQPKEEPKKEVNKQRCAACSRKLKLLGIECRCGSFFCSVHRLPQDHSCEFNHKNAGKEKLAKQVIKVDKAKIQSI